MSLTSPLILNGRIFFVSGKPDMVAHVSEWLHDFGYTRHHPDDPGELYVEEF